LILTSSFRVMFELPRYVLPVASISQFK
jgi:hypothetical protein